MLIVVMVLSLIISVYSDCRAETKSGNAIWDLKSLYQPPKTYPALDCQPQGEKAVFYDGILNSPDIRKADAANNRVKTMYYDGLPFQGKPTRVFAYYGLPEVRKGEKVPAIVLVHGGGGTAFESWVRLWNTRGYAAIAMDVCGCLPIGEYGKWQHSQFGGPAGWGGMDQIDWPISDQWTYQAVADIILADSFLRSQPEIDPGRIGITGISWGGFLTCIASSIDKRFKFAVPIYGCGFLGEDSIWLPDFEKMGQEKAAKWLRLWDPSQYLPKSSVPILWVAGTNDHAYPIDSLRKTYQIVRAPKALCIRVNMVHAHGGAGENPEEILAFADTYCKGAKSLPQIVAQGRDENSVWTTYKSKTKLARVELNYTCDTGKWLDRHWQIVPGELSGANRVTAVLPVGVRAYYLNLIDERGLMISTEHVEVGN